MIFVASEKEIGHAVLLESLGIHQLEKVKGQPFDSVMSPGKDMIYIGTLNGNTIICTQDIPSESLDASMSPAEMEMSARFDQADIVTFVLHSTVNLWGYSIVQNGQKIRVRAGSADNGTILEYGAPLEEEKGLLSQSSINESGERVFKFDDLPNEEFTDDQVGENFVFAISANYFGEQLDHSDKIFETEFDGYIFSRHKLALASSFDEKVTSKKPWWKFW
ncbi:MAG: hypothetical protein AAF789_10915 [Bacteroidota bacterium]